MGKHGIRIPQTYAPHFRDQNIRAGKLELLWTYRFLCEICERVMSDICRHHAIQRGHEEACELVKNIFGHHAICWVGVMNKLRRGRETLIMARDYWSTCHFIDSTCKNSNFLDKAADDEMLNISKHTEPMWQVLHHRVTYRAVIPKIGHILSPSERANQKHPTMQIKRQLKKRQSKI